jgi:2-hydroxycyclohexanecarboxyl-CoA dehydrogenase
MSQQGRNAVVTGGGSGIGRATAIQLAKDGAAVAVWDLNDKGAQETVEMIKNAGGRAIACKLDASSATEIAAALKRTRAELGPVTILVNNAGITAFDKFDTITEELWDRVMRVNLKGPFLCSQAILPDMRAAGWGRIINISSSSAQSGASHMCHYVASKGGVIGFTKALARELAAAGITVNNVPPGFVDTPMLRESERQGLLDVEASAASYPMKRAGKPEDIAMAVSYLASDGANYVTGHTLSVNGGRYSN